PSSTTGCPARTARRRSSSMLARCSPEYSPDAMSHEGRRRAGRISPRRGTRRKRLHREASMAASLSGKVAIVTGASSGFGRAIALAMARHGARIVVGDIREEAPAGNFDESPGQSTVELVAAGGGDALFVPCDVSRQDDVVRLVGRAVERFGGLDILVNNAGVWRGNARMHELPEEALEACWSVLVKGSWFCAQEAIKAFLAQGRGGNIINIVS